MHKETLSISQLLPMFALIIIPIIIMWSIQMQPLIKEALISIVRMTVQLSLVGFYLHFLFEYNNAFLNVIWICVMLTISTLHTLKHSGLSKKKLFWIPALTSTLVVGCILSLMLTLISPVNWYDTQYLIPLAGILLGNCLCGSIIALERFYHAIFQQKERYMTDLLSGANLNEAVLPYLQDGIKAAIEPTIATMATVGIVTLPGMMTGQILNGASPMTAVAYQMLILIGIFVGIISTAFLNIILSTRVCFNSFGLIKPVFFSAPN